MPRRRVRLLVGLALSLAMVLVAPAAPASGYVQPYGRYQVWTHSTRRCLTVQLFNQTYVGP